MNTNETPARHPVAGKLVVIFLVAALLGTIWAKFSFYPLNPWKNPELVAPEVVTKVTPFVLTDANGATVTLESLKGRVWVADFFFTYCSGLCPRMHEQMKKIWSETRDWAAVQRLGDAPLFVSITADPKRDTPEALAEYAKLWGVNDDRWKFLTGSVDAIHDLSVKGFLLANEKGNPDTHSGKFVLIDRDGNVRGHYDGTDEEALKRLRVDLLKVLLLKGGA